jgi:hypothetical protein
MVWLVTVFGKLWKWHSISNKVKRSLILFYIYLFIFNINKELAIIQHHLKVDHYVQVILYKFKIVIQILAVQLMVIGLNGEVIRPVVQPVVQVFKLEFVLLLIIFIYVRILKIYSDSIL